ncbi:hypothetical protein [Flagellimonas sp.]|uniref:hypothetical protein n=1 Tax=Flagellimonas sp. TaxID=2058762 RepID=UPI003F49D6B3
MKKIFFAQPLFVLLISLLVLSCSNNDDEIDSLIGNNEEQIVNEENSTDDDSNSDSEDDSDDGEDSDDDSTDDNTSDDTDGDNNSDDSSDDDSGDDNNDNDSNGGDDTNNDDTNNDDGDTNNDDSSNAMLLGDWRLASAGIDDGRASTLFNGVVISFPFSSTSQDENVDVTFRENPNVIEGMGEYTNVISFTILSQTITEETPFESPLTDGNWEMVNDELVLSDSSSATSNFTIRELTADTLILETDFEQTVPTDDFELDVTGVLVIELSRN